MGVISGRPFVIGTAGPEASGKTTLAFALARHFGGLDAGGQQAVLRTANARPSQSVDFPAPEFSTGIYYRSLNPAYFRYASERREFTHVDTPGNPAWGHLTLWGISQIDGVILVVRASQGVDEPPSFKKRVRKRR